MFSCYVRCYLLDHLLQKLGCRTEHRDKAWALISTAYSVEDLVSGFHLRAQKFRKVVNYPATGRHGDSISAKDINDFRISTQWPSHECLCRNPRYDSS